jgi:hypothetical protein
MAGRDAPPREAPPCPPNQCKQCWDHAHVVHPLSLEGVLSRKQCSACWSHFVNGCNGEKKAS